MRILVTGATGFVGKSLCSAAIRQNLEVSGACRFLPPHSETSATYCAIGNISTTTDWSEALKGCSVVIHLAGAVHLPPTTPATYYHEVNVDGTGQLLKQAALAGVKRFIYVSSIGVNGSTSGANESLNEQSPVCPESPYAKSKLDAEDLVQSIAKDTAMEWVIVRPPMVYGTNAPGNADRLVRLIRSGLPLPFAGIRNQRSFVSIDNLSSALLACATHPAAANNLFLVSDGIDFSTPAFVRFIAQAMQLPVWMLTIREPWLRFLLRAVGKITMAESLCDSLRINSHKIQTTLDWHPFPTHLDKNGVFS